MIPSVGTDTFSYQYVRWPPCHLSPRQNAPLRVPPIAEGRGRTGKQVGECVHGGRQVSCCAPIRPPLSFPRATYAAPSATLLLLPNKSMNRSWPLVLAAVQTGKLHTVLLVQKGKGWVGSRSPLHALLPKHCVGGEKWFGAAAAVFLLQQVGRGLEVPSRVTGWRW